MADGLFTKPSKIDAKYASVIYKRKQLGKEIILI